MFIQIHMFAQEALSSSLSQYTPLVPASEPLPTRVIAAQHSPAIPTTKPLCQFLSAWETFPRISRWLLCIRARVLPSIQMHTTLFQRRGVVSNSDSKFSYPKTELCKLLRKEAIEQVPASKLECSFSSRYLWCPREMVVSTRY